MESNKKILLTTIGIAVLIVTLVGVTYSFFNYTRTGLANNIKVGRIYFNTSQNGNINLTNVFPIKSEDLDTDQGNHDSVTISITGDTTYSEGIEYLITFTDVNNTINNKEIPIAFNVESIGIGTSSDDYYNERGGNTSYYKLTDEGIVADDKYILAGYIAQGQTGINGSIEINAFIDADKIAITDTYDPKEPNYEYNTNMTQAEIDTCASYLDSNGWSVQGSETLESFCDGTGTNWGSTFEQALRNEWFTDEELEFLIEHNIIIDTNVYTDLTTTEWVNGRTVFTTSEWNNFQGNHSLSFKVKVEANEGIWVDRESTPTKCFTFSSPRNYYKLKSNLTETELNSCISILSNASVHLDSDSTYQSLCEGTGTSYYNTLEEDINLYNNGYVAQLLDAGIITFEGYQTSIINYDASCGTDVVIPKRALATMESYVVDNISSDKDINTCVSYIYSEYRVDQYPLDSGESLESFCNGDGTIWGNTLENWIDNNYFSDSELTYLESINIIRYQSEGFDSTVTYINGIFNGEENVGAFENKGITSVVIPNTVYKIGGWAFFNNPLTTINIPNSVRDIEGNAFSSTQITELNIPDSVISVGYKFAASDTLTSLTFGSGIKLIYYDNFLNAYNPNLTSVTINRPCSYIWNMGNYPWSANSDITIYGSNNEVCHP